MTHENQKRLVARVVDNEATDTEKALALDHIAACAECESLMKDLVAIRNDIAALERAGVSEAVDAAMMERAMAASRSKISYWQIYLDGFKIFKPAIAYAALALALGVFIGSLGFRLGSDRMRQPSKTYLTEQEARLFDAEYPGSIAEVYHEVEKGGL